MKICVNCNTEINDDALFCIRCGTKQYQKGGRCTICNTCLPEGAKFCPACGTKQVLEESETWDEKDIACVRSGDYYGFVRPDGLYLTKPIFSYASSFSNGLARVELDYKDCSLTKHGYIGMNGRFAIVPKFDEAFSFSEGFAIVKVGEKFGYIKPDGSFLIKPIFIDAKSFSQGKAKVKIKSKEWEDPIKEGEVFPDGTLVIDGKHVDVTQFHHISLTAKKNPWDKVGFADVEYYDKWIIPPHFDYVGRFGDDDLAIVKQNGKYGFVRTNGEILSNVSYDDAGPFSEGLARVRIGKLHGYIKTDGSYLVEPQFEDANDCFEGGRVKVTLSGDMEPKFLSRDGKIINNNK